VSGTEDKYAADADELVAHARPAFRSSGASFKSPVDMASTLSASQRSCTGSPRRRSLPPSRSSRAAASPACRRVSRSRRSVLRR
jgi:hypothetical protein